MKDRVFESTDIVRETGYAVHCYHGPGHLEKVYENAPVHRLRKRGIAVDQQKPLTVYDEDGTIIGEYVADIVVEGQLILEVKAARTMADDHIAQTLGYLRSVRLEHGAIVNFGAAKFQIRKLAMSELLHQPDRAGPPSFLALLLSAFFVLFGYSSLSLGAAQQALPAVAPSGAWQSATGPESPAMAADNPSWKVLVLIYTKTDFRFSNDRGEHHLVGAMTEEEKTRAETQARRFFERDVPELTGGNQRPVVTIRFPARTLTRLDDGYWPGPGITAPDVEPSFDSVVVIWKASGTDQVTGTPLNVADAGGLAQPRGTDPTYCAIPGEYISARDRNVFKHEWGHSILFYFDAAGKTATPAVDNHINDTDTRYVHWPSGTPYILKDETDDNPIPNSIYNNRQGFTHDYYMGQTAAADKPQVRLGITPGAWASGGPVMKPEGAGRGMDPRVIAESAPAPLYRDPVYDGAADPVLVWNPGVRAWQMFYTQRRAKLDLPGVEWCHQTEIGVAQSRDGGMTWTYLGTLALSHPDAGYSFWAPDVIREDDGRFHLFVSYVPGAAETHRHWGGQRHILHYVSDDLWCWTFEQRVPVSSDSCIDPTLFQRPDGSWRMWYKDEGHHSDTFAVESRDLKEWKPVQDPGVSKLYGEGPKVFRFRDSYWLIKDPGKGLDVYQSADLESWTYRGKILDQPGRRNDDAAPGQHADVVVCGDRAYIIYFTHPDRQDFPSINGIMPLAARRSSLQAAELEMRDGKLVCDRDKPFRLRLSEPERGSQ